MDVTNFFMGGEILSCFEAKILTFTASKSISSFFIAILFDMKPPINTHGPCCKPCASIICRRGSRLERKGMPSSCLSKLDRGQGEKERKWIDNTAVRGNR